MVTSMKLVVFSRCRVSEPVVRSCTRVRSGSALTQARNEEAAEGDRREQRDQHHAPDQVPRDTRAPFGRQGDGDDDEGGDEDGDTVHEKNPMRRPSMATPVQRAIEIRATALAMPGPNLPSGAKVTRWRMVKVNRSAATRKYILFQKYGLSNSLVASEMNCGTPVRIMPMMLATSHGRASRATRASGCCENPLPSNRRSTTSRAPARNASATRCSA